METAGRAKGRQAELAGTRPSKDLPANLPEGSNKGDARDIAAEKVGLKPRTAEKAAQVVEVIDTLKERGATKSRPRKTAGNNQYSPVANLPRAQRRATEDER